MAYENKNEYGFTEVVTELKKENSMSLAQRIRYNMKRILINISNNNDNCFFEFVGQRKSRLQAHLAISKTDLISMATDILLSQGYTVTPPQEKENAHE